MSNEEEYLVNPEGMPIHEWMAAEQQALIEQAMERSQAYLNEIAEWIGSHPDSTFAEREAAINQIKLKYPRIVELERKQKTWDEWKDAHGRADMYDKEEAYNEIWGYFPDKDEFEEDPDFWDYEGGDDDE